MSHVDTFLALNMIINGHKCWVIIIIIIIIIIVIVIIIILSPNLRYITFCK